MQLIATHIPKMENSTEKNILIFDDDADILEVCQLILSAKGFNVFTCGNSNNIIEEVAKTSPSVIFMDNQIPDLGGVKSTQLLKSDDRFKNIPVIYFSASNEIESLAKEAGADGFLPKPFNIQDLENKVRSILG